MNLKANKQFTVLASWYSTWARLVMLVE